MNFAMYVHPSDLRLANTRRVYRSLLAAGRSSRADLARRTGLSAVTTGKVVDQLIEGGLLEEVDLQSAPTGRTVSAPVMGRPPRVVCLSRRARFVAVQLGARECSLMSVSLGGQIDAPSRVSVPSPKRAELFLEAVAEAKDSVCPQQPLAVLVSVPGVLDERQNRVLFSPNLRWTEHAELLPALGRAWSAPVVAVQEVQSLALGHQAFGGAPESFLLIEFTDGVGGAVVTNGRLLESPFPMSGEIGHIRVPTVQRRCGCGNDGCLETLAGRPGLIETFRTSLRKPRATWQDVSNHVASSGVESWLRDTIEATGMVIAGAVNLLGLREVVAVGELTEMHPDVILRIEDAVRRHALCSRFAQVNCRAAPGRRILGLVAAATDRVLLPEPALVATRAAG
ncbi:MAG: N-acetylglucosamine repressor [Phycisphaerales bacterium]|nr:N-acetylglucosamine repressor [Phycisphaerales bacterium]